MTFISKRDFLLTHPPAGGVDEPPKEVKVDPEQDRRMTEAITAGLKAAMPEIIKPLTERLSENDRRQPVTRTAEPATIVRPSEEDLIRAITDGNSAEAVRLQRQMRDADRQETDRKLAALSGQGGAAISAVAKLSADRLPFYKDYKKEIDGEIEKFQLANPGAIVTPDHYEMAHKIVVGNHIDEIRARDREETLRKAREPEPDLTPDHSSHDRKPAEAEPTNLKELFGETKDWELYDMKKSAVGGRTDEEELRRMGFKGGFAEYAKTRKEMRDLEDKTGGSMGLDRDFDKKTGEWI